METMDTIKEKVKKTTIMTTIAVLIFFILYIYLLKSGVEYDEDEGRDVINFDSLPKPADIGLYPLNLTQTEILRKNTEDILSNYKEEGGQLRWGYNAFLDDNHNEIVSVRDHKNSLGVYPAALDQGRFLNDRELLFTSLDRPLQHKIQEDSKKLFHRTAPNQNHPNMGNLMDIYKTIKPGLQALTLGVPLSKQIDIAFFKHTFIPNVGTILSPSSTLWHRDYSYHNLISRPSADYDIRIIFFTTDSSDRRQPEFATWDRRGYAHEQIRTSQGNPLDLIKIDNHTGIGCVMFRNDLVFHRTPPYDKDTFSYIDYLLGLMKPREIYQIQIKVDKATSELNEVPRNDLVVEDIEEYSDWGVGGGYKRRSRMRSKRRKKSSKSSKRSKKSSKKGRTKSRKRSKRRTRKKR